MLDLVYVCNLEGRYGLNPARRLLAVADEFEGLCRRSLRDVSPMVAPWEGASKGVGVGLRGFHQRVLLAGRRCHGLGVLCYVPLLHISRLSSAQRAISR